MQLEHTPDRAPRAFAAYVKDRALRAASSSGGLFSALALQVLEQGGVVYGAAMTKENTVCHTRAASASELAPLRGSKYVQSNMGLTYRALGEDVKAGRAVLFVGTPCQVAGARSYLDGCTSAVLFVELACHGVPSAQLWRRYLDHMERHLGSSVVQVSFRSKRYGWKQLCMTLELANGKKYVEKCDFDIWYRFFYGSIALRRSCGACHFKGDRSRADITLADLWGSSVLCPKLDGEKGTSLVVLRTEAGKQAFDALGERIEWREVCYTDCVRYNRALEYSEALDSRREAFLDEAESADMEELAARYSPILPGARLKKMLFSVTKTTLRRLGLLKLIKRLRKK